MKVPLSIDSASVVADLSRVDEMLADIKKHDPVVREAEKDDKDLIAKWGASATNAATKANLEIYREEVNVTNVDTAGFAFQFRTTYADYQRLLAEGSTYLASIGVKTDKPLETVTQGLGNMEKGSLKIDEAAPGFERFRAARRNLNTAAGKMDSEVKSFRAASQGLQSGLFTIKAKAAAAQGAEAQGKLTALKKEIDDVAKGVGTAVKVASALSGFVGTGGAVSKTIGDAKTSYTGEAPDPATGVEKDPGAQATKMAIAKSIYADADKISAGELGKVDVGGGLSLGTIISGDPAAIAEGLVKLIGTEIHADKITALEQNIAAAAATEKSFSAGAAANQFRSQQSAMAAAAASLSTLVGTYMEAKQEEAEAGEALMAHLKKTGGKKGSDQSKVLVFLTDADRFIAQATTAITNGKNQQSNAKDAAETRKSLRGTTKTLEGDKDRRVQVYWQAKKYQVPGKLWGTNDAYKLTKVDVTFTKSSGGDYNEIVQGGQGSIEGAGGAADAVARKLELLEKAKAQVEDLRNKAQNVLGLGGPGRNA